MRVDFNRQQLGTHRPAAASAALVAAIGFLIVGPLVTNGDRLADVSAQTRSYSEACVAASSGSSADCQEIPPLLLEPALRSLDGVTHHG
jgi:hypothetical protein